MHHSISIKILHITHLHISQRVNKLQLCTYHLTVSTRQSTYVYVCERHAKSFSYKAILNLEK